MSHSGKKRTALVGAVIGTGGTLALVIALAIGVGPGAAAGAAAPSNTSLPTITGTPQEGQTLAGQRGQWSGSPTDYDDFWVRCGKNGGSCANISGAHDRNGYLLKKVDVGNTIRFKVQAKNAEGSSFASSVPTAVIGAATGTSPPVTSGCSKKGGSIPIAGVTPPSRLTIDQTQISPSTITYGTRAVTARFHVAACSGSVEGALVYDGGAVRSVRHSERAGNRLRRLGDGAAVGALRLSGQQEAATARGVRPCPQVRRGHARRHLDPPARLVPRHRRLT